MSTKAIALTHQQTLDLLQRIAQELESAEDARDFCLWLRDTFNHECKFDIDLTH
jgi:hypothetical protein